MLEFRVTVIHGGKSSLPLSGLHVQQLFDVSLTLYSVSSTNICKYESMRMMIENLRQRCKYKMLQKLQTYTCIFISSFVIRSYSLYEFKLTVNFVIEVFTSRFFPFFRVFVCLDVCFILIPVV